MTIRKRLDSRLRAGDAARGQGGAGLGGRLERGEEREERETIVQVNDHA